MATHAAFLRGMNLGRRRLKNPELKAAFESLGFAGVEVFLASGNVVFDDPAGSDLATRIAAGLETALGYPVPTFIRSAEEIAALSDFRPFDDAVVARTAGKLQVILLEAAPASRVQKEVLGLAPEADQLRFHERALFWLPRQGISDSELDMGAIEKRIGRTTIRTANTLQRLARKFF